jgi:hypothetical protein
MVTYNLSHLKQPDNQKVIGPLQDDEALLLFSIIRIMRIERVFEMGFLKGYSAINFLEAVGPTGTVYSCDIGKVRKLAVNHVPLEKNAKAVTAEDLDNKPIELMFFDCHSRDAQMTCFNNLKSAGVVTDKTILVLHDTGTHSYRIHNYDYEISPGEFVHQPVERGMVNEFAEMGYSPFCLHIDLAKCGPELPFRHGITFLSKFSPLKL